MLMLAPMCVVLWIALRPTSCFRLELGQQVLNNLPPLLQSVSESEAIRVVNFDGEPIEAVLQEFLQFLFFDIFNI